MTELLAFESPRDLLLGLSLCWKPELFPEEVVVLDRRLAVPADGFEHIERIAQTCALPISQVRLPANYQAKQLASIAFGDAWEYRDPLRWNGEGRRRDSNSLSVSYDPNAAGIEYLLAATDRGEAGRLLDCLMLHVSEGVDFVPLMVEGTETYRYFWLVHGERPPLDVLQRASRAWWGPSSPPQHAFVFVEWPWSLRLPPQCLQRIPWHAGNGHVLLSRESPQRMVIASTGAVGSLPFESYGDVTRVPIHRARVSIAEVNPRFPVTLTLARDDMNDVLARRIGQVRHEIDVRKEGVKRLEIELQRLEAESEQESFVPEPLLLFASERASEVPLELRRLLIEWSNQPGDLDALVCARFQSADLPKALELPYEVVHVVTTATALGRPGRPAEDLTLRLRLLDYVPHARLSHFVQLTEWAAEGLRMFVPDGLKMHLHPRLHPGPVAAQKLAEAFFGTDDAVRRAAAALLLVLPTHRQLVVGALDADAFKPLVHAFDWHCGLNVDAPDPSTIREIAKQAESALAQALVMSLDRAVHAEAGSALSRAHVELKKWMDADAKTLANYRSRRRSISSALEEIRPKWEGLDERLESLQTRINSLRSRITAAALDSTSASAAAEELQAVVRDLDQEQTALGDAIEDLQKVRSKLE